MKKSPNPAFAGGIRQTGIDDCQKSLQTGVLLSPATCFAIQHRHPKTTEPYRVADHLLGPVALAAMLQHRHRKCDVPSVTMMITLSLQESLVEVMGVFLIQGLFKTQSGYSIMGEPLSG